MDEPPTFRVWAWPTLGGWLSLLNLVWWVVFVLLLNANMFRGTGSWAEAPIAWTAILMSPPFGCILLAPGPGYQGDPIAVAVGIAIGFGLNAFAWGYGVALLIGGVRKWIAVLRPRPSAAADAAKGNG